MARVVLAIIIPDDLLLVLLATWISKIFYLLLVMIELAIGDLRWFYTTAIYLFAFFDVSILISINLVDVWIAVYFLSTLLRFLFIDFLTFVIIDGGLVRSEDSVDIYAAVRYLFYNGGLFFVPR
jgi:hypothetical protein